MAQSPPPYAAASASLDRIMGSDWTVPEDRSGEVLFLARIAANSGSRRDILRLAGVLMIAAGEAPDETVEIRLGAESIAHLDSLAAEGCEVSADVINLVAELVPPATLRIADRVNRELTKEI